MMFDFQMTFFNVKEIFDSLYQNPYEVWVMTDDDFIKGIKHLFHLE